MGEKMREWNKEQASTHKLRTRKSLSDLPTQTEGMFQVMDSDGSGRLSFQELCTEIKKLVRKMSVRCEWKEGG
jgi:hypothetical protein